LKHPRASYWFRESAVSARHLNAEVVSWLTDQGSLTRRLQNRCGDGFSVRVLNQQWVRPGIDEARLLQIHPGRLVLLRQVQLLCADKVLVYARSVIPLSTLRGRHRRLQHLGNKPLGEYLFANPSLRRKQLQLATILRNNPLFSIALSSSQQQCSRIWGRRSLFTLDGRSLLVSEYFLPELFEY
jgi:chorismate lyase